MSSIESKKHFQKLASNYITNWSHGLPGYLRRRETSSLLFILESIFFDKLLDLGSGPGLFAIAAKKRFNCKARLIDISEEMILEARKMNPDAHVADIQTYADDQSYSLVTSIGVMEFLSDQRAFLDNLACLITKGGHLLLFIPAFQPWKTLYSLFYKIKSVHLKFPKEDEIIKTLSKKGFFLERSLRIFPTGKALLFKKV